MSITLDRSRLEFLATQKIAIHVPHGGDRIVVPEAPHPLERYSNHSCFGVMPLGAFSYSHSYCRNVSLIGRYCSIGAKLSVVTNTHPTDRLSTSPVFYAKRRFRDWGGPRDAIANLVPFEEEQRSVKIGNDVWIGDDVSIRAGVSIGHGAIIAKGAMVTRDVEAYSIIGGVPARRIRMRFDLDTVTELLASRWWRFPPVELVAMSPAKPAIFLRKFHEASTAGTLRELKENRITLRKLLRTSKT